MKPSPTLLHRAALPLLASVLLMPLALLAHTKSDDLERFPNFDRRSEGRDSRSPGRSAAAPGRDQSEAALRGKVNRLEIVRDDVTDTPAFVGSAHGFLTGPGGAGRAVPAASVDRFPASDRGRAVKAFIDEYQPVFGHRSDVLDKARVTKDYVTGHNGLRTVVWQQEFDGIGVFEATLKAHLTANDELVNISSRLLPNVQDAAQRGNPKRTSSTTPPGVSAAAAVAIAARNIGEDLADADVTPDGAIADSDSRQRFRAPTLLDAEAHFIWLPIDAQTIRLCWEIICTGKTTGFMFRVIVDAETGEMQVRQSLTEHVSNASYRVFTSDSPSPFSPGFSTPSSAQPPLVARTLVTTPGLNLTASPNGWIDDGVMETRGNNVDAHTDLNADNIADLPRPQAVGPDRVFDFPLDLTQSPSTYRDAAVVNLFYWCNFMHDKLYELGFTEAAGNFQVNNFGRGGLGNDAVQADAQDGSGTNNANFSTPPDGSSGRMQMYVFTGPTPDRDGDLDAEVMAHEYTHGLTNRLVGGGVGMSQLQSRGMGEGWSDFYALCLLSEPGDDPTANYASGGYSSYQLGGLTENYYYGIRRYPYSTNLSKNPLTFKDIDPAQASAHTGIPRSPVTGSTANEVHNMGEVWCVTLWDVRANLIAKYGATAGNQLMLQLTTDGLKLSPANPTFLQARDAILQADLVDTGGANRAELWAAFAKRGMGFSAYAPANSTTSGLIEAFDPPDSLSITPLAPFAATGDFGGPFTPSGQTYTLTNTGAASLSWTASKTQPWITLGTTSGTLAPGATTTVTASFNAAANALAVGSYSETISFKDTTSGQTQTRPMALTINPPRITLFALDSAPAGWTTTGEWAFGHPTGGGGSHGFPDPSNGATGSNVFGVNLAGDYSTAVGAAAYLTAGPFNFTGYANTRVQFQRWLNTDYQPWVTQTIEVSRNGTTWTRVWDNGNSGPTTSGTWTKVQHDISTVADNQPTVYVRWGHQITASGAVAYSGWNIDDIETLGQTGAAAPTITTQPVSQIASVGNNVTFTVAATGLPVPSYQWNFNGAPIPGATSSTLTLTNVQFTSAGSYTATVYNSIGSVMSATATLTGNAPPPTIGTQPANVAITSGQNATFSVAATGTQTLAYQWRRNGFPIAGATGSSFTIANARRTDADYYDVLVAAGLTPTTSQSARLTVAPTAYPTAVVPDPAWNLQLELSSGNGFAIASLADGRAYVAGSFTGISGRAQTNVARINADGTLDLTFTPPTLDNSVRALAVQSDGRLIIGGDFLRINGFPRNRLARLNTDGSLDTTFAATANGSVSALAVQSDGRLLVGGSFTTIAGSVRNFLARLNADGSFDATFATLGVNSNVNALALQADGKIVVGGAFTSYFDSVGASTSRQRLARLNASGTLDTAFAPSPSSTVNAIALQTDGKVVIGGLFSTVTGTTAPDLARLNADGTVDTAFTTAGGTGLNGSVNALAVQADGRILAGGNFTSFGGTALNRFARLNTDGSRDATFQTTGFSSTVSAIAVQNSGLIIAGGGFSSYFNSVGTSTSRSRFARLNTNGTLEAGYNFSGIRMWGTANALLPLPGGKLLVTGIFTSVHGATSPIGLLRLNADGTVDPTFSAGTGANSNINAAALQPDGKIVITGFFSTYNGATANGVARLNADGTLDSTFSVGTGFASTGSGNALAILPGGRVLVAGGFTTVNGVARNRIAVLNSDGSVDPTFAPSSGASSTIYAAAVQPDGKYVIGGAFTTFNGTTINRLARLNTNGTLDTTLAVGTGPNSDVSTLALQPDGKVVIGGFFTQYNGTSRSSLARVNSTGSLDTTFVPPSLGTIYALLLQEDGRVLLRGTFNSVGGAANTSYLGRVNADGSRDTSFAAAGFMDSSNRPSTLAMTDSGQVFMQSNGVAVLSATQAGGPPVLTAPADQIAFIGGSATFAVTATSALPVTYQWSFNNVAIAGATSSSLVLTNVQLATAGSYQVVATSEFGTTTSAAATLTVNKLPAPVAISNVLQVYDGGIHAVTVDTTPPGLSVAVTYDGSATPPTNVGSYAVVATVNDPVFTGSATATLVIAKAIAPIALDGLTAIYDGTPKPITATPTPAGLTVVVTYAGSSTPPTNAGTYAIEATIVDANYAGTATGTLTIGKAPATITLGALGPVYDGTPKAATAATTPPGLNVALTYNGSPTPPTGAGSYAVAATIVDPNYAGNAAGTLVIAKAAATLALDSLSAVYDGTPKAATATTTPAGLNVTFTYDGAPTPPTNAGTYAVVATVVDPNYAGTTSGTLTITKATATILLASLNATYDGSPKPVTYTTQPAGLTVAVTYDGAAAAPTNVGTYAVEATIVSGNYTGSASATLTIAPATATITIGNLAQNYDGTPRPVAVTTSPANLAFTLTYNGSSDAPTAPGAYAVVVTITEANYTGSASATLIVSTTVLVRHAPAISGGVDGSVQVAAAENLSLGGNAWLSGDLLVIGTPTVQTDGHPTLVGVRDGTGSALPGDYQVSLTGNAALRYLVRRIDPAGMPAVDLPPLPAGARDVVIATLHHVPDDWTAVRDITIPGSNNDLPVPSGTYGDLTIEGSSSVVLGVAGATQPSIYNLQRLALRSGAELKIAGPVIVTVAGEVSLGGKAGEAAHPEWFVLRTAGDRVAVIGNATLAAQVIAPNAAVSLGSGTLTGVVTADRLAVEGGGLIQQPRP